jgi:hypothetical protein
MIKNNGYNVQDVVSFLVFLAILPILLFGSDHSIIFEKAYGEIALGDCLDGICGSSTGGSLFMPGAVDRHWDRLHSDFNNPYSTTEGFSDCGKYCGGINGGTGDASGREFPDWHDDALAAEEQQRTEAALEQTENDLIELEQFQATTATEASQQQQQQQQQRYQQSESTQTSNTNLMDRDTATNTNNDGGINLANTMNDRSLSLLTPNDRDAGINLLNSALNSALNSHWLLSSGSQSSPQSSNSQGGNQGINLMNSGALNYILSGASTRSITSLYSSSIPAIDSSTLSTEEFLQLANERGIKILSVEESADMTPEQVDEYYRDALDVVAPGWTHESLATTVLERRMPNLNNPYELINCGIACSSVPLSLLNNEPGISSTTLGNTIAGENRYNQYLETKNRPYIAHLDDPLLATMHRTGSLNSIMEFGLLDLAGGKIIGAVANGISDFMSPTTLNLLSRADEPLRYGPVEYLVRDTPVENFNGLINPAWRNSVEDFVLHAQRDGYEVLGREVSVAIPDSPNRIYDVLLRDPRLPQGADSILGVELKSTLGAFNKFNKQQTFADQYVNRFGGTLIGDNAKSLQEQGIHRIYNTMKIYWE